MSKPLKVRKIGSSLGVLLPKELLAELGVGEGDLLYPVRTPEGMQLAPHDPKFAEVLGENETLIAHAFFKLDFLFDGRFWRDPPRNSRSAPGGGSAPGDRWTFLETHGSNRLVATGSVEKPVSQLDDHVWTLTLTWFVTLLCCGRANHAHSACAAVYSDSSPRSRLRALDCLRSDP